MTPGRSQRVMVYFHPSYEGRYTDTLLLFFHVLRSKQRFAITRRINAIVGSHQDHETLKPKGPFVKRKFTPMTHGSIVRSSRPPVWTKTKWRVRMPAFDLPQDLRHLSDLDGRKRKNLVALAKGHLPPQLNRNTHEKHFRVLLYAEEEARRSAAPNSEF
jgi:helicase MOV-10